MLQATLRPNAAKVSKKIIIFTFSHTQAYVTKFDLGIKWVKVNEGHTLNDLSSTHKDNATYQVSRSLLYRFWRRRFLSLLRRPCWSFDPTHLYKFSFPFSHKLSYELWFQITQLFLRKTSFTLKSEWPLTKVKEWPWPLILTHLH